MASITKNRSQRHKKLLEDIDNALKNTQQREALLTAQKNSRHHRDKAYAETETMDIFLEEAREVKRRNIDDSVELVEKFTEKIKKLGGKVFLADNEETAVNYILNVAKDKNVKSILKSKTLTGEEISINEHLEEANFEVIETDLGERIVQLAHERPIHIVAPAIHKNRQQIADLFTEDTGKKVPPDPEVIAKVARESLRKDFLRADMGISGGNIAVAETGTIVLVTNEGNARLTTTLPETHIAIIGIEKVVRSLDDAMKILEVLPKSATGQKVTSYFTFINGRNQGDFHVVLLDNGRTEMKKDNLFKEALYCIRCGACMNICPTFNVVGGHVFGHIYPAPIGLPWTNYVHGEDNAIDITELCISCGLCKDICPEDIDIPLMISTVKEKDIELYGEKRINKFLSENEKTIDLSSKTAPIANWMLKRGAFRFILEKITGLDRRRPMPSFSRKTFFNWFKNRETKNAFTTSKYLNKDIFHDKMKVVYFVDTYANYNDPEIGISTVKILEKNNVKVEVPPQKGSAMPLVLYGYLDDAKKTAKYNVDNMLPYVKKGYKIVTSEPTAAFTLKEVYPKLLETQEAELVGENTFELFGYLSKLNKEGKMSQNFKKVEKEHVGYHMPCHSRPLDKETPVAKIMEMIGLDVEVIDHGCCGMAGTYGFRAGLEGYDVSMEIAKPLCKDFSRPEIKYGLTESSVCSMQITHGSEKEIIHPITILKEAYELD